MPASSVVGTLVGSDGAPAQGYWIGEIVTPTGRHVSDFDVSNGTIRAVRLPAGTYRISVDNTDTREVVWFDGSTTADGATTVTLGAGETKEITFHLP